jgi:predicted dienelactone hydrolase
LIVFSHGFGGIKNGYEYLGTAWANSGYMVIFPTHLGSDHDAFLQVGGKTSRDPGAAFDLQKQRTADISFIISSLDKIEQEVNLRGKIDRQHTAASGHSMGAGTALLLGGEMAGPPGGPLQSFRDDRVKAVVAMSPQGAGEEGFAEHSWDHLLIPVMTMSGTLEGGVGGEPPSWRLQPFQHMAAGDKYQVTAVAVRLEYSPTLYSRCGVRPAVSVMKHRLSVLVPALDRALSTNRALRKKLWVASIAPVAG